MPVQGQFRLVEGVPDGGRGLGQEAEEPLVQVPEKEQGRPPAADELAAAAEPVLIHGTLDNRRPVLVDEPGGESVVLAAVVEVVGGVEGEHVVAGQFPGYPPDVADAQDRVDQRSGQAASIRKLFTCTGSLTRKMPGSRPRVANRSSRIRLSSWPYMI
jgi:hypothetical protein